ncbi:MAG: cob(I)yrinic acid a,c-diamide adenosyltransferase [Propionibacteriaceae bacterium]|nr:cob(I)yrinic acid a,c-diamide adenosyltransferase [Propionibacteriaceae bacterium]
MSTKELRNRPIVAVHTGDGKGKTTAAVGMALRAWAQGWNIGVYQFVKSEKWRTGEHKAFSELPGSITWEKMGTGWSWSRAHTAVDPQELAQEGWARIREGIAEERHRFWLLDEFTYPLSWGWVDLDDVLTVLAERPGTQHVVITGRRCPQPLIDAADLVTEMVPVKHPFTQGQRGQAGIEW